MKLFSLPLVHCSPRRFFMPGCYFFLHKRERGLHLCGRQGAFRRCIKIFCGSFVPAQTAGQFRFFRRRREKEKSAGFRAPVK